MLTHCHRKRGSVFILVLSVLSVLVLLTLTLSYISRMDLLASRNWAAVVQQRMAALAVPPFQVGPLAANLQKPAIETTQPLLGPPSQGPLAMMAGPGQSLSHNNIRAMQSGPVQMLPLTGGINRGMQVQRGGGVRAGGMRAGAGTRMIQSGAMRPGITGVAPGMQQMHRAGPAMGNTLGGTLGNTLGDTRGNTMDAAMAPAPSETLEPLKVGMEIVGGRLEALATGTRAGRRLEAGDRRQNRAMAAAGLDEEIRTPKGLSTVLLEDESAKLNINAVVPDLDSPAQQNARQPLSGTQAQAQKIVEAAGMVGEAELARLIEQAAAAGRIPGVDARALAHRIALRRYGPDGRPGLAYTDDNANNGTTDVLQDTIDNDRDGLADEDDEYTTALTHDGLDNNRNGLVDETGETIASDGLDNNHNGQVDEPNEAVDDPAEAGSDPRRPALGDDTPYTRLEELMAVPGMTPALYRMLSPYLTTFSVSFAAFTIEEGLRRSDEAATGFPQIDPNTAPPDQIFQVLKQRFPKADRALLGQFTANLIDRRDLDDLPSAVQVGSATYYGMELNPCLNEVCPDPNYGQNKDGRFIELFNPWSKAISLSGWSVRGTGGVQIPLEGSLPAGGYMVLTDDISNENDQTPEDDGQEGSFYNVFQRVGTGIMRQLVEVPGLKLPVRNARLMLVNADGYVVDEFVYGDGRNQGACKSFQRVDPRLRKTELATATPLDANMGLRGLPDGGKEAKRVLKMMEQWQNQPLRSPLDVMLVSTAHTAAASGLAGDAAETTGTLNAGGEEEVTSDDAQQATGDTEDTTDSIDTLDTPASGAAATPGESLARWAFLVPALSAAEAENLDARLVDCFRIGAAIPPPAAWSATDLVGVTANGSAEDVARQIAAALTERSTRPTLTEMAPLPEPPRCMAAFGRVNLNTAPAAVISTLPGMTSALAEAIVLARGGAASMAAAAVQESKGASARGVDNRMWWTPEDPLMAERWQNLSDFILDETLWNNSPLYDRLDAVYPFSQAVTLHSMALRVVTASRPLEPPRTAATPTPTPAMPRAAGIAASAGVAKATGAAMGSGQEARLNSESMSSAAGAASEAQTANNAPAPGATRRPATIRAERIIAGDRGAPETVAFGYLRTTSDRQVDPDARHARAEGEGGVRRLDLAAIVQEVEKINARLASAGHGPKFTAGSGSLKDAGKTMAVRAGVVTEPRQSMRQTTRQSVDPAIPQPVAGPLRPRRKP